MNVLKKMMTMLLTASCLSTAFAADNTLNHPGYVDFSSLSAIANAEPSVEISLKAPILNMVTNLIRTEEEEAANFISKLLQVTVNVFESSGIDVSKFSDSMNEIASQLDEQGWDRVVRVREDGEHVDVYFRLSDDADVIHGIAIMVAESDDTVFVNIVGDISTDDLSALGRRFDIDELVDLDVEVN